MPALSGDGNTLAVGAPREDSTATGIGGDQTDNSALTSGAVYVFRHNGIEWGQEAYVKASNTGTDDQLGYSIALSYDGNTLAVGAPREDSAATGIGGDQTDISAFYSGAVYVFRHDGMDWAQQAYVKASNTETGDHFGMSLALSDDGNTLAVGAMFEASAAKGINGNQGDNAADGAGAVYVFRHDGGGWAQQAYVKASNTDTYSSYDNFGVSLALSADGNTLAVGAPGEDSIATGINGDQTDITAPNAGAAYVFRHDGVVWAQDAYIKPSNTRQFLFFGASVALSVNGQALAVAAPYESSAATGIDGDQADESGFDAGALYLFRHDGTDWAQHAYVKASNTNEFDYFGDARAVALNGNGSTLAVGAYGEASTAGWHQW